MEQPLQSTATAATRAAAKTTAKYCATTATTKATTTTTTAAETTRRSRRTIWSPCGHSSTYLTELLLSLADANHLGRVRGDGGRFPSGLVVGLPIFVLHGGAKETSDEGAKKVLRAERRRAASGGSRS